MMDRLFSKFNAKTPPPNIEPLSITKVATELVREGEENDRKLEGFARLAENADDFIHGLEKYEQNYERDHGDDKEKLVLYKNLVTQLMGAIRIFRDDVETLNGNPVTKILRLEGGLDVISETCRKLYKLDKTF